MNTVTILTLSIIEIQLWNCGLILAGSVSTFKMISGEDCVCVGDIITYECSVIGGTSTVFRGSGFNSYCFNSNNEITLLHSRFPQSNDSDARLNATGTSCNNGAIMARSVKVENGTYISRLDITFNNKLYGKTISCFYDNGTAAISVGNVSLQMEKPAPPSPPMDISWELIGTNSVMFTWSPVIFNCSNSKVKYNIFHTNCGSCPNTTSYTYITCTYITNSNLSECMLAVQTVVCGNISGDWSSEITLRLKDTALSTAVSTEVIVTSVTVPVSVILVGITVVMLVTIMKRKSMQKAVTTSRPLQNNSSSEPCSEVNLKPKPRFHFVPSGSEVNTLGYSLCQSDYDEITVTNNNYSHLDYYNAPRQPAEADEVFRDEEDDDVKRQSITTGCVRLEDEYLDLESLLTKLRGRIKCQWYHFGLTIGVPDNILDQLRDYSEDDCLVEVLDYWLKNHPDQPTWKELADAVADLQDYELANSLLKIYSGRGKDMREKFSLRLMGIEHQYKKKKKTLTLSVGKTAKPESNCDKMQPPPHKYNTTHSTAS